MTLYKTTYEGSALAWKLILKGQDVCYYPGFQICDQDTKKFLCVLVKSFFKDMVGLFIKTGFVHRLKHPEDNIPVVLLLMGDEQIYFYSRHVTLFKEE